MPKSKKSASSGLAVFEGKEIRRHWDDKKELWYFSVVDVISALSKSENPQVYWRVLKKRLTDEGSNETVTKCNGLKMIAADGKMRLTDVADTETMFRIIQSIPSPNAEPFKLWLARVGYERVEETTDPEVTILTDEITFAWAGLTTKKYKSIKGLKKENLRDNMTNLELVLNMLGEVSTTEISKKEKPQTFEHNRRVARKGGGVAGAAREKLESETGRKVISRGA